MKRSPTHRWLPCLLLLLLCPYCVWAQEASAKAPPGPSAKALPDAEMVRMLRKARIARLEGRTDDALAGLRAAAEAFPVSVLPVMALWEFHRQHTLPAEEGKALRALLTRRLSDPTSPLPPGTLRYLVENPDVSDDELILVLDAALSRMDDADPNPRMLEAVGILQERLGRLPEARATLGRLLELEPSPELQWHCLALDERLERWLDVARGLRRWLDRDPLFVMRMRYIEVLGKLGDHEELVRQLDLLSQDPAVKPMHLRGTRERLLLQAAWDLRDAGEEAGAEKVFRRLLAIDPDNAVARNAILHLYSTEEERAAHQAALEELWSAEDDPEALAREGASLLAGGDAEHAFELLERAAAGLPESEITWFNLGLAAIRLERWEAAEQAMLRAVALNPSRVEAHLYRGAALQALERCEEAVVVLKEVLATDPGLSQAHYYLHFCYHALGHYDASQAHLRLYNQAREAAGE